jgi:hypothetical protein
MVGARVPPDVRDGLDAMSRRLRVQNPNEPDNRSVAIRTSFHIAEVALRGDRLEKLSRMGRGSLSEAVEEVLTAGFEAIARRESGPLR